MTKVIFEFDYSTELGLSEKYNLIKFRLKIKEN